VTFAELTPPSPIEGEGVFGLSDFRVRDISENMSSDASQKVSSPLVGEGQGEGESFSWPTLLRTRKFDEP